jgi:hypothetical protein
MGERKKPTLSQQGEKKTNTLITRREKQNSHNKERKTVFNKTI